MRLERHRLEFGTSHSAHFASQLLFLSVGHVESKLDLLEFALGGIVLNLQGLELGLQCCRICPARSGLFALLHDSLQILNLRFSLPSGSVDLLVLNLQGLEFGLQI